jgi:hypothetical protein
MVKVPVVTTFAMDEPEIRPVMAEPTTAALAGPAAQVPEAREGELDEVVARARLIEERAEEDEEKHEGRRNAQRNAEDAPGVEPLRVDQRGKAEPLMLDQVRDQPARAHVGVKQEERADDCKRRAQRAAAGLEQHQDTDGTHDDLELRRQARARGQGERVGGPENVEGTEAAHGQQDPVRDGMRSRGEFLKAGISEEGQHDREEQVQRPRLGRVHHREPFAEPEHRLRDPELEQRPDQREPRDQQRDVSVLGIACTAVGACNEVLKFLVGKLAPFAPVSVRCHRAVPLFGRYTRPVSPIGVRAT